VGGSQNRSAKQSSRNSSQGRWVIQPRIINTAIAEVASRYSLTPGQSRSTTISIVRWDKTSTAAIVLGDSPVIVQLIDGSIHQIRDYRLAQLPGRHIFDDARPASPEEERQLRRDLVASER
jgi:hypothetical protein